MSARPLILASKSSSRRAMLNAAGVSYQAITADLDERAIEDSLEGASAKDIALALAVSKAQAVAVQHQDALVLGSDSLIVVEGRRFDKPTSKQNAAEHLRFFSGKVMELHSAAALVCNNSCEWSAPSLAKLHVRDLGETFIEQYLDQEWPEVSYCVGVFRIEALGVQLFEQIEGDQFTVLGMPLLGVLGALRELGELPV